MALYSREVLQGSAKAAVLAKNIHEKGKETYSYGKRDLLTWQKRPPTRATDNYLYSRRDLRTWEYLCVPEMVTRASSV